jgi:ketosteroid isomerase-like protein
MSEANKNLVRRHFEEIWNRRDLTVCEEIMAVDYTENAAAPFAMSSPGKVNGPAAMRGSVAWLTAQYPDIHMELESIVAEDDLVAVRVISTGTNLGRVDGGKPFRARQSHWFRVSDGQLCEHWATRDDLTTMLQLGVIQAPGNPPTDQ